MEPKMMAIDVDHTNERSRSSGSGDTRSSARTVEHKHGHPVTALHRPTVLGSPDPNDRQVCRFHCVGAARGQTLRIISPEVLKRSTVGSAWSDQHQELVICSFSMRAHVVVCSLWQ